MPPYALVWFVKDFTCYLVYTCMHTLVRWLFSGLASFSDIAKGERGTIAPGAADEGCKTAWPKYFTTFTTDAIFMARQMQENFRVKGKKLYFGFVDLEKAFDRVPTSDKRSDKLGNA